MDWHNLELITFFLAILVLAPLAGCFPAYVVWFWRRRREAKRRGLKARPSGAVMIFYVIFLLTFLLFPYVVRFEAGCRCDEVKTNLGSLFTAQFAYFGEYDTFAGGKEIEGEGVFNYQDCGLLLFTPYTYYIGNGHIAPPFDSVIEYEPDHNWPCTIRPEAGARGFTIMAIGNIDDDPCLDVWMMNDAKYLKQLVDDKKNWVLDDACLDCPGAKKPSAALKKWEEWNDDINFTMQKRLILAAFPVWFSLAAVLSWLLLRERRKWSETLHAGIEGE